MQRRFDRSGLLQMLSVLEANQQCDYCCQQSNKKDIFISSFILINVYQMKTIFVIKYHKGTQIVFWPELQQEFEGGPLDTGSMIW